VHDPSLPVNGTTSLDMFKLRSTSLPVFMLVEQTNEPSSTLPDAKDLVTAAFPPPRSRL
jgi:hypothetical protein